MLSQWECLLKNLGEWQGSFTRYSVQGEELEDTPTIVTLEGRDNNTKVHQVVHYLPHNQPPRDLVLEYTSLSSSIRFFENGAFSQGALQWGPYSSQFGAESGLIAGKRRLRMVQLFDYNAKFDRLTLIREKLAGSTAPEQPILTVDQLLGEWRGEAVTLYQDWRHPDVYPTHLCIERQGNQLSQKLTFGDGNSHQTFASVARIEGSILHFDTGVLPIQVLLLPDGASCNCPVEIKSGQSFFLEIGWLFQPSKRHRLIRSYDAKGELISITLVQEEKIG